MQTRPSIRVDADNPDHHLWNNHGTWWIHFTVHTEDHRKQRIRRSLGTHDLDLARSRRDLVLAGEAGTPELHALAEGRQADARFPS